MLSVSTSVILIVAAANGDAAGLMTELVSTALSTQPGLDVLTSADVRRQLDVEAEKMQMGCDEKQSCLAELANAMGARYIVHGKLGRLASKSRDGSGDVFILTLNLFDSERAQAAGRVATKESSLSALSDRVEPAALELVQGLLAELPRGQRARVLVLDVEAPQDDALAAARPIADDGGSVLPFLGGGVALLGVGIVGAGVVFHVFALGEQEAAKPMSVDAVTAQQHYDARNVFGALAITSFVVGAAAAAGGALVAVVGWVGE